jgi:ribosomal protein L31
MQKNIHSSLHLININCISCQAEYQNYSTVKEDKKINTCANCNPAYKGKITAEIKIEKAEKFSQRQQKEQEKAEEKKLRQQKAQQRRSK